MVCSFSEKDSRPLRVKTTSNSPITDLARHSRNQNKQARSAFHHGCLFSPVGTIGSSRGCKPPETFSRQTQSPGGATRSIRHHSDVAPPGLWARFTFLPGAYAPGYYMRRSAAKTRPHSGLGRAVGRRLKYAQNNITVRVNGVGRLTAYRLATHCSVLMNHKKTPSKLGG